MPCQYLTKDHKDEAACLIKGNVCFDWLDWFNANGMQVPDRDKFCEDQPDDFDPDII